MNTQRAFVLLSLPIICLTFMRSTAAASLQPAAAQAWNRYYQWEDAKVSREVKEAGKFLIQDRLPEAEKRDMQRKLAAGETYVARVTGVVPKNEKFEMPNAEIHHWWGAILIPKVKLPDLMRFLKDYDHHAGKFSDVVGSKLISQHDDHFTISLSLMRSKAFVTARYNTVQEATYYTIDAKHVWSKSEATRIAEIENVGTAREKELPPGEDSGFLWRLVSWWRFEETNEGVIIEIDSASLSRDIPWLAKLLPGVSAYIRATPKESLESVLLSIRKQFTGK